MGMKLEYRIARRYLLSDKKSQAINWISAIAILGIAIGSCSTVLVGSVFNGLEEVIMGMFNDFNPDIKVLPAEGKKFSEKDIAWKELRGIAGVSSVSRVLEETAIFEYREKRDFGVLKGVDRSFESVINMDNFLREGEFQLNLKDKSAALVSTPLASKVGLNLQNRYEPVRVYMKRKQRSSFDKAFSVWPLTPVGRFDLSSDENYKMVITELDKARRILGTPKALSAAEIGLNPSADLGEVQQEIRALLGPDFLVQDREEQERAFLKLMNVEKWVGFAILSLTLLLISFNMIGAMWMIVLEKEVDISVLKALGLSDSSARKIFLIQGFIMSLTGLLLGFALALMLYFLQENFGLIRLDTSMPNQYYPVELKWIDLAPITIVVLILGFLAALPAAQRAYQLSRLSLARI